MIAKLKSVTATIGSLDELPKNRLSFIAGRMAPGMSSDTAMPTLVYQFDKYLFATSNDN